MRIETKYNRILSSERLVRGSYEIELAHIHTDSEMLVQAMAVPFWPYTAKLTDYDPATFEMRLQ